MDSLRFKSQYGEEIFSSPKHPHWPQEPPSLLCTGYCDSLPAVKQPGCEVNNSPPSSAKVKNEWSYTSTPLNTFMA
jgi:hypothetical protein